MENNQPTKIVSKLYKRFQALQTVEVLTPQYWKDRTQLCKEKLCAMESSLRFMPPFRFLMEFSKTVDFIK